MVRIKGNLKFFSKNKGYGFIIGDDNQEYFVSYIDILNKAVLKTNDEVEFESIRKRKGLQALNVIKVGN